MRKISDEIIMHVANLFGGFAIIFGNKDHFPKLKIGYFKL